MAHGFGKMRRVEQSSCSEGVRRCNEAAEVRLRGAAVRMVDERKGPSQHGNSRDLVESSSGETHEVSFLEGSRGRRSHDPNCLRDCRAQPWHLKDLRPKHVRTRPFRLSGRCRWSIGKSQKRKMDSLAQANVRMKLEGDRNVLDTRAETRSVRHRRWW
jgi:hypothetical protein